MRLQAGILIICAAVCDASTGDAASPRLAAAARAFKAGALDEALALYVDAYAKHAEPEVLYWIGICNVRLGHAQTAASFLDEFVRTAPTHVRSADAREQLLPLLADLATAYERDASLTDMTAVLNVLLYHCDLLPLPTWKRGAKSRATTACGRLGYFVSEIWHPSPAERIMPILTHACDAKIAAGCGGLGFLYAEGRYVSSDKTRGVALLRRACDLRDMLACSGLGYVYEEAGDYVKAISLYRRACGADVGVGCEYLAYMYERGWGGLPLDLGRAEDLYGRACVLGRRSACAKLH